MSLYPLLRGCMCEQGARAVCACERALYGRVCGPAVLTDA